MTDLDLVRMNIQDGVEPYTFADDVIQSFLDRMGDVNQVSAHFWMLRAGNASLRNFKFSADGRTVDKTMQAKECREQAAYFLQQSMTTPADAVAEIAWTGAFNPPERY
ncbi:hypothetical protein H1S01_03330 [Heliobacterium chlorum]|uniref:Uncharacterized protein n=1 Tax=Heliobacterium chlorum TaxID=2698 RepID=A0ABR7SYE0_HELCL|nr:hypothetical protein [Heliobacterium chlorum]MBC9783544.1 hypothetical protein [Heliobacterium chlorum]